MSLVHTSSYNYSPNCNTMIYVQCYSFGSHGSVDDDIEVRFRQGKNCG